MAYQNAINAGVTGLVKADGSGGFTGVTTTQHDLLIGAASNGITSVAPSATSGVPVISQGASADPVFGTAAIAGGGTNATSMSTSTGIVKYDGTSLVTSTTAKIDSSNRYLNSSQTSFLAYLTGNVTNATGDGTTVNPIVFNATLYNVGSGLNTSTGIFTAPVAGLYVFSATVWFGNITTSHFPYLVGIVTTGANYLFQIASAPGGASLQNGINGTVIANMAANDTAKVECAVGASTKTVSIIQNGATDPRTTFSGFLLG